jgi:copper chaperone
MIELQVKSMSCDHCVKAVTQAVKSADAQAQVHVDLASGHVTIQPAASEIDRTRLVQAIEAAGYEVAP